MEPGRELDRLVAEKVMGWVWKEQIGALPGCAKSKWLFNPDGKIQDVPYYSTDIADAWLVVEHLSKDRHWFDIGRTVRGSIEDVRARVTHWQWTACVDQYIYAHADTAPHAICLSALRAIGVNFPTAGLTAGQ